jgi:hypothetical protein
MFETDVLADDYDGNVLEYLSVGSGVGILVRQPWNNKDPLISEWEESGRLMHADNLYEALRMVCEVRSRTLGRPPEAVLVADPP